MITTFDELIMQLDKAEKNLIFLVGNFDDFAIHNFAVDNNYLYIVFEQFMAENNIDSSLFKESDARQSTRTTIGIDKWTQKIAFKNQKHTVVIDGFSLALIPDLLAKNLLMQELLYISKSGHRLITNIIIVIDTKLGTAEEQILPKILQNSLVVKM
ncbi:MAG: hypothetical protein FK733_16105 [Asgard group archaeon]|nr:hypothetical protein [Asgard group archaeon]